MITLIYTYLYNKYHDDKYEYHTRVLLFCFEMLVYMFIALIITVLKELGV